ncbi:MAG: hypothetical protein KUL78_10910 [Flavobacterium sp.]|nr:hypothetical protein [Flavobacterium sp.]
MIRKILPSKSLVYHSFLTKEELLERLRDAIETERLHDLNSRNKMESKPYFGEIQNSLFKIRRVIDYRNSFLPQINGEIIEDENGTKIKVEMKLISFVKFFMIIWFSFCAFFGLILLVLIFDNDSKSSSGFSILIPIFMLIFATFLVSSGFESESEKSIKDLEEILQAKLIV